MKPQLKHIDTNSASSLQELCANSPENFGFWINASIGSDETEGSDDFQFFVCNRGWLEAERKSSSQLPEKYLLVEGGNDSFNLTESLNTFLAECDGTSWTEVVEKISRVGKWEFEGYQT